MSKSPRILYVLSHCWKISEYKVIAGCFAPRNHLIFGHFLHPLSSNEILAGLSDFYTMAGIERP